MILRFIRAHWRWIIGFGVVAGLAMAMITYNTFMRQQPAPFFESDEEHFLYGSVGTEEAEGVPYWIWLVLPRIFPDLLPGPGGYASLGVLGGDGHEMPIGLSKVTIGFPRVGINCAMCHASSVRATPDGVPTIYPAATSQQTSPQEYLRFLAAAGSDPRFTAGNILNEISRNHRLSMYERLVYRFAIIPFTGRALRQLGTDNSWMYKHVHWGRGRIDPFNPVKFRRLGQPIDDTVGHSDMMPLWNLAARKGPFHWDGLNDDLREVVQSSALGDGATKAWVDRDYLRWNDTNPRTMSSLRRVYNYISRVQAPRYPFPIDRTLADAGAPIYQANCAQCHAPGGARTNALIPVAEVGTDPNRIGMWTPPSAASYNAYGEGHAWDFSHFKTNNAYVSTTLEGLWLRAPYLHNGSVPSLADLLEPADKRTPRFWRGYDVYDPVRVGFISDGPEAKRIGTEHDITKRGNSNAGHVYGVTLTPEQKKALLEYLKTL